MPPSANRRCSLVISRRAVLVSEVLMIATAVGSWFATPKRIHDANAFHFHPIREVAWLFVVSSPRGCAYLLKYALPILIPLMVIIAVLFFSRWRVL